MIRLLPSSSLANYLYALIDYEKKSNDFPNDNFLLYLSIERKNSFSFSGTVYVDQKGIKSELILTLEKVRELNNLLEDIVAHFRDEEEIFKHSDFPGSEDHCIHHSNLVSSAVELSDKYQREELSYGELFSFLAYDVVAQHMFIEDRKFFPYIQKETV